MSFIKRVLKKIPLQKNRKTARTIRGIVVGVATAALISLAYLGGLFNDFERMSADWRRTTFTPVPAASGIVNVTISQHCLESMQADFDLSWPWPREVYGAMTDYLKRQGAGAILFDIIFSEFSKKGVLDDRLFIQQIKKSGSVFFSASFLNSESYKSKIRRLQADIPTLLPTPLFDAVLKKTKEDKERALLKRHYTKSKDGTSRELTKKTRYRIRKRLNSILVAAGLMTKSLQAVLAEIKKVDKLDRFKLPVSRVSGPLPSYANLQSPPYEEYIPAITGIGNVYFEEDPDGVGRRKAILFRHFNRYFPDLSLAAIQHVMRITNIVKEDRQIILYKNSAEIDGGIFENNILAKLNPAAQKTLRLLYYPVPPYSLTPGQVSNSRADSGPPAEFNRMLAALYGKKTNTNFSNKEKPEIRFIRKTAIDPQLSRRFSALLEKQGIKPALRRRLPSLNPKEQHAARNALKEAGYGPTITIPTDPSGKVPIKFYGSFEERSGLPIPRRLSADEIKSIKAKLSSSDQALFMKYYRPLKKGGFRKRGKMTHQDNRLLRFLLHRGGRLKRFSMSIRAYDLITAAARPEYARALKIHPDMFRNKIIMIGSIAPGLMDLRANPFNKKDPGFYLYTSMIENILNEDFLYEAYNPTLIILIIFFLCILTGLAGTKLSVMRGILVTLAISLAYGVVTILFFTQASMLINMATVQIAVIVTFIAGTVANYFNENKQKSFIQGAFSQLLAPAILDKLMEDPTTLGLGGEEKELTIFFSDLQGFTSLSEELGSPQKLVEILNEYLTAMSDIIIMDYDGYVDKYEGDAIMAFWGAPLDDPNHAWKACHAALDNQKKLKELQSRFKEMGLTTDLKVRIGMNTGIALVGMMGSIKKLNYTIIGDSVNLASRLEGANKQYGSFTMISEATYEEARDHIIARPLDLIRVKGKQQPTSVYELMAKAGELDPAGMRLVEVFTEGVNAYRGGHFQEALDHFIRCDAIHPGDGPSAVYMDRCRQYLETPPDEGWDGVFTMTTK